MSWTEGQICKPRASKPQYDGAMTLRQLQSYWPQEKLYVGRKYVESLLIGKRTPCSRNVKNAAFSLKTWADQNGYTVLIYTDAKIVGGVRKHCLYIYGKKEIQDPSKSLPHYVGITSARGGVQAGWDKRAIELIKRIG